MRRDAFERSLKCGILQFQARLGLTQLYLSNNNNAFTASNDREGFCARNNGRNRVYHGRYLTMYVLSKVEARP